MLKINLNLYMEINKMSIKYVVWNLDVWSDGEGTYEVNDRSKAGTIQVDSDSDENIFQALKSEGYLKDSVTLDMIAIDNGDEGFINVDVAEDAKPLFQLERSEEDTVSESVKYLNVLLENVINEASDKTTIDSLVADIEKLTDENAHTYSVLRLAEFLKNKKSINILKAINTLHDLYGSMPEQLIDLRGFERQELLKQVESKFGKDIRNRINSAF